MADLFGWAATRGGKRQRTLAAELAVQSSVGDATGSGSSAYSHLEALLLEKWACKEMSAIAVQEIAEAVCRDGFSHPGLCKMAGLGSGGRHPNNCNRDLLRSYKLDEVHTPPVVEVELPVVDTRAVAGRRLQDKVHPWKNSQRWCSDVQQAVSACNIIQLIFRLWRRTGYSILLWVKCEIVLY